MPITEKMSPENVATGPVNPCLRQIAVEVPAEAVTREMQALAVRHQRDQWREKGCGEGIEGHHRSNGHLPFHNIARADPQQDER